MKLQMTLYARRKLISPSDLGIPGGKGTRLNEAIEIQIWKNTRSKLEQAKRS